MKVLLTVAGVLVIGLAIVACGGGNGEDSGDTGDKAAIESMVRELLSAFEDGDAGKLADLSSSECGDIEEQIASVFAQVEAAGLQVKVDLTGISVRNLEEDSAEVAVEGTVTVAGQEQPLGDEGEYTRVVKENGEWKVADCAYFLE